MTRWETGMRLSRGGGWQQQQQRRRWNPFDLTDRIRIGQEYERLERPPSTFSSSTPSLVDEQQIVIVARKWLHIQLASRWMDEWLTRGQTWGMVITRGKDNCLCLLPSDYISRLIKHLHPNEWLQNGTAVWLSTSFSDVNTTNECICQSAYFSFSGREITSSD